VVRLGLFGGSFDPIHNGHLIIAQEAVWQLGLDRVVFIPTARPPHKPSRDLTAIAHRMRMAELAVDGLERADVSALEADDETAYTVDTLRRLHAQYGSETRLHLLLGEDSLCEFETWRDPEEILRLAALAVYGRPGWQAPPVGPPHVRLLGPLVEISSSEIRDRVAAGRPIRFWVPEAVRVYIARNGLYRIRGRTC
jgi:nicotinate-nucleotide adenylyltransferase